MATSPPVDLDLLRKYDVPAPRYTSYPTALQFDTSLDADAVGRRMAQRQAEDRPVSLYVHLPFCQSLCWYCACTRVISKERDDAEDYVDRLIEEMKLRSGWIGDAPVVQIHLGGGTPTFLTPGQILRLGRTLRRVFDVQDAAELAVEIDPRECTDAHIDALRDIGFNRASLGVQDNNEQVQKAVHRVQPWETTLRVTEGLREAGFDSINYDLIYGLPHQTPETFGRTLDDVVDAAPDRLAVYSYAHVPWVNPAQKHLEGDALPGAETKLDLLKHGIERLGDAGFRYIGMDHFARPDDELARALDEGTLRRNFQGYSTGQGVDIHGFGMSAISQTQDMYFQNRKELPAYRECVDGGEVPVFRGVTLDRDDRIRRRTIEHLMCRRELPFDELSTELEIDFEDYFADALRDLTALEEDGLVDVSSERLRITDRGRLFLRNIAMPFDAYLDSKPGSTSPEGTSDTRRSYSRSV
jgi:oxygen-independent coproporphyrinogen-3 oxidase